MSSDSSEDETNRLREAVDNDFFNDLFDSKKRKDKNPPAKQVTKPSLRYQEEEINHMRVTEGFQKYVGTQLMKFLDSKIKEVEVPSRKHQIKKDTEGGIRLFGASPNTLSCDEGVELAASQPQKRKKWKPKRNEEKISKEEQCKEAAVPAEWILSKDAVVGWEPSTKGKLESYSADDVVIKSKKLRKTTENVRQVLTPEEKAEKKKLKRKRCRERLKNKANSENEESSKL